VALSEKGSIKAVFAAALAGAVLVMGGLLIGGSLVGAQEASPTPEAEQQTAPDGSGGTERTKEECDKDGDGMPDGMQSSGGGVGFFGGRGLRQ
jgi:hypothetical protein